MITQSPCPFCFSDKLMDKYIDGWSWIECKSCGFQGPPERLGHGGDHNRAWEQTCFSLIHSFMNGKGDNDETT